jgi:hypothetical protein
MAIGFHVCGRDCSRPGTLHAPAQYMMSNYELQESYNIDFAAFFIFVDSLPKL